VKAQIDGFRGGGEYTVKASKQEAVDLFHQRRPDWPLQRINKT
jgi:hypothetical protein